MAPIRLFTQSQHRFDSTILSKNADFDTVNCRRHVCGDRTIHPKRHHVLGTAPDSDTLQFHRCSSKDSEREMFDRFMNGGQISPQPGRVGFSEYAYPYTYHKGCDGKGSRGLDLTLLRTCKSIYDEAKDIPFHTNTFSLLSGRHARAFAQSFPPQHREKIRKAHIDMSPLGPHYITRYNDEVEWKKVISHHLTPTFPNIQHLDISICIGLTSCWLADYQRTGQLRHGWMRAVLALRTYQLKTVTINIGEDERRCKDIDEEEHDTIVHLQGEGLTARRRREMRQDIAVRLMEELLRSGS